MLNEKGQWDVREEVWGVLELVWPKPGMFPTFFLGTVFAFHRSVHLCRGLHQASMLQGTGLMRCRSSDPGFRGQYVSDLTADEEVYQ